MAEGVQDNLIHKEPSSWSVGTLPILLDMLFGEGDEGTFIKLPVTHLSLQ